MFGPRFKLFRLLGFDVHIDLSWVIIAVLVAWSLAGSLFPEYYPDLPTQAHWAMGIVATLGLFLSIVLHELSHSLVARRFGIPMRGITLFIFGGVADMSEEPPSGKAEFFMAIAGPLASVVVGGVSFGIYALGAQFGWPAPVNGVFLYLGWINLVLVAFNLIPAFPLDGGRVLRAALWSGMRSLRRATRISAQIGSGFGLALIILGVVAFIGGNVVSGMWWFLIGMFLRGAAQMSYQQVLVRRALEGESVRKVMRPDPVAVRPDTTLQSLVDDYIYAHHFKMFPVVEDGRPRGCVTTRQVRDVPREEWGARRVREILAPCTPENTIDADADALRALSQMNRTGASRLMVMEGDRLVGVVALKDLMRLLALKMELEGDAPPATVARLARAAEPPA